MKQTELERLLKMITKYDGAFSKQDHIRYLKWLEAKTYEKTGLDISLTDEEVAEDTRGFRLSQGA